MPLEIITSDGRSFRYREYELPALEPTEVRVRVEFAAPKHGTELHAITGSALSRKKWDPEYRMFLPRTEEDPAPPAERRVGNMVVGSVIAVGADATRLRVGERVFGYGPIREEHQQPEKRWRRLEGLSVEDAVCTDPAHVAFVAARDGNVRIGDHVAIFGLGAIGLLAVQVARAGGAAKVIAVDPVAGRRECARAHGADLALDPRECDAAFEIKRATGKQGVDVALETSGSAAALHEAIRCIRQCGTVVHVPWGPKDASALHLDEEFHLNRPTLVASQAVWDNPDRAHPLWTEERARLASIELFRQGKLTGQGIVTPIIPFREAPALLGDLMTNPDRAIKVGVTLG